MDSAFILLCILARLFASAPAFANALVAITPTPLQGLAPLTRRTIFSYGNSAASFSKLFLSLSDTRDAGPTNDSIAQNEFSRPILVSKWFTGGGGPSSNRGSRRKMDVSLHATPSERRALAARFRLTNITDLSADMVVRDACDVGGSGCIQAMGTVCAQVTQKCVRTNEEFAVSLKFDFDTVLKAMSPTRSSGSGGSDGPLSQGELMALDAAAKLGNDKPRKRKGGNKRTAVRNARGGKSLDATGMKQLQDIMEYEVTDEMIEDESCFCTDGVVDCGEIVAQIFRSKLDPYPKKPGTDPVTYSFTF